MNHLTTDALRPLITRFQENGALQLFFKPLSPNDNSKNQVYLGPDYQALNLLPFRTIENQNGKLKAALDFWWLDEAGQLRQAPTAQLILYPQYPEVRLSGFLRGCPTAPTALMTSRAIGRVLFLGITRDRRIIAHVVAADHPFAKAVADSIQFESNGVFFKIEPAQDSRQMLLQKLREIHLKGWIASKRLDANGTPVSCNAPNCGGYTLEAELGITPNGIPMPDFLGYEVKQYGVTNFDSLRAKSPVTLMTPEPTGGYYRVKGVEAFIRKYGYADLSGKADRLNFGGVFRYQSRDARTTLTLKLIGYDPHRQTFNAATGGIVLVDDNGDHAASWDYSSLLTHWSQKHAKTVYVPSLYRTTPWPSYRYGATVSIGNGTDFLAFLKAIEAKAVYYDPGIKMESASAAKPIIKRRSQFRIKVDTLQILYHAWEKTVLL